MSGIIRYSDFPPPKPMKPKRIGACCVCRNTKTGRRGSVYATDVNRPNAGTCKQCGVYQSFHTSTISISKYDIKSSKGASR